MPQKRMAARGQSAKLAKGPSLKKMVPTKAADARKSGAVKPKANSEKPRTTGDKTKDLAGKHLAKNAKNLGQPTAHVSKATPKTAIASKPVTAAKAQGPIEKAKAALKKATGAKEKSPVVEAPAEVKTTAKAKGKAAKAPKAEGKRSRKFSIDISPNEAASALAGKWSTLFKKADQIEAQPYNMRAVFEERTAITHKVLGWGYILANRNDRLEVLFKDGIKYLISNYKP